MALNPFDVWPFVPNWSGEVQEKHEFRTEIITSRSGKEQRRSLRLSPRVSLEYRTMAARNEGMARMSAIMHSRQGQVFAVPQPGEFIIFTTPMLALTKQANVNRAPGWLTAGVLGTLIAPDGRTALVEVEAFSWPTVGLVDPADETWPAGTRLYLSARASMADSITLGLETRTVGQANVSFDLEPGQNRTLELGTPEETWNGREVFLRKPNWAERPSIEFETYRETVDYGFGRTEHFRPRAFNTRTLQLTFLGRNREDVRQIVGLFHRMSGQRDEFYMPSPIAEITPIQFFGGDSLKIAGADMLKPYGTKLPEYEPDTINANVAVRLIDGTLVFRKVSLMLGADALDEQLPFRNTILVVDEEWGFDPSQVFSVSWLPVWRFATDSLTIEWLSNEVAQFKATMKSLEDLEGA